MQQILPPTRSRALRALLVLSSVLFVDVGVGSAQSDTAASSEVQLVAHESVEGTGKGPLEPAAPAISEAERIARLQRSIDSDEARLKELSEGLENPLSDYAKAEEEFQKLDSELSTSKRLLQEATAAQDADKIAQYETQCAEVSKRWTLAREQFQLEIEQRKTEQASIANLETKIRKDREALSKLKGNEPPRPVEEVPLAVAPAVPAAPMSTTLPEPSPAAVAPAPAASLPVAAVSPVAAVKPGFPSLPSTAAAVPAPSAEAHGDPAKPAAGALAGPKLLVPQRDNKALVAASQAAQKSAAEAQQAEREAASITERVEILRADIELQRRLKEGGRKKVDSAEDALRAFNDDLNRKLMAGDSIEEIGAAICEAQDHLREAKIESRGYSTRLDELQTELATLQQEQLAAMQQAERARKEAEQAQRAVDQLNNPFTTQNLLYWLSRHGVVIVVILTIIFGVLYASRNFENRLVSLLASRSRRGSREERENRARTLVTVLQNAACTITVTVGTIMVLEEFGVPIGPLLGGAAVIGLAVAFGAQSLIKDYFTGFMVLMEQQYMINDVVKIGETVGQVERISLRMTVLRDLEGRVHFIPHGEIHVVTNLTHGWSRAVFDIMVSYKENVDQVIDLLTSMAQELRSDPNFGLMILDDPQMLGVDALNDNGVSIKFCVKTRPLRQWDIKRELLRRIKNRFDQLGIEIPYPQRMLYVRSEESVPEGAVPRFRVHKAA
jgi:small-conductance mechanosensitive channel